MLSSNRGGRSQLKSNIAWNKAAKAKYAASDRMTGQAKAAGKKVDKRSTRTMKPVPRKPMTSPRKKQGY